VRLPSIRWPVACLDGAESVRRYAAIRPRPTASGVVGWLLRKQSEFYREISSTIRAARTSGSGFIAVFGARLVWAKGWALIRVLRVSRVSTVTPEPAFACASLEGYNTAEHGRTETRFLHAAMSADERYSHEQDDRLTRQPHIHHEHCGHSHGPQPGRLGGARRLGTRRRRSFCRRCATLFRCTPGVGIRSGPRGEGSITHGRV
jgi:ABC-type nickel/cobalt efflux system permease component RcnA